MSSRTVIRGGLVITTSDETHADVLIEDGRIAALAASGTFETGTRAAAWGGTTTIVDFAVRSVGRTLREGLDTWHAKAEGNCASGSDQEFSTAGCG